MKPTPISPNIRLAALAAAALLPVLVSAGSANAQVGAQAATNESEPPVASYEVRRATGRIIIDGRLDEEAWQAADGPAYLDVTWDSPLPMQRTQARLLWDDEYLYVGYIVEDSDITAQFLNRDDPTYQDDAVEIFINPRPEQTAMYFGLEMNARAVLYDYLAYDARFFMKRFNMDGVRIAVHIDGTLNVRGDVDNGWSLEVAIPWINFEEVARRPTNGTVWTANLNRWDGVQPARRMSIWSDPLVQRTQPHVPARFGRLIFVE